MIKSLMKQLSCWESQTFQCVISDAIWVFQEAGFGTEYSVQMCTENALGISTCGR